MPRTETRFSYSLTGPKLKIPEERLREQIAAAGGSIINQRPGAIQHGLSFGIEETFSLSPSSPDSEPAPRIAPGGLSEER